MHPFRIIYAQNNSQIRWKISISYPPPPLFPKPSPFPTSSPALQTLKESLREFEHDPWNKGKVENCDYVKNSKMQERNHWGTVYYIFYWTRW